jgi:hypothetical protein
MAVRNDLKSAQPGRNSHLIANTFFVSDPFAYISCGFNPLASGFDSAGAISAHNSIEFRDFRPDVPDVILSMQKRALIRRIGLFLCRGWTRHIAKRWRSSVSSGPSLSSSMLISSLPLASLVIAILPPDSLYRGLYRGINISGA